MQDGLRRMYQDQEDVFYYITVMNENYPHPGLPKGEEKYLKRNVSTQQIKKMQTTHVTPRKFFREVIAAAEMLRNDWGVESDIWDVRVLPS